MTASHYGHGALMTMRNLGWTTRAGAAALAMTVALGACDTPLPQWKGNLHTHSVWSDGADYPEMIVQWYVDNGYNFLALTEHDIFQEGERWVDINAPDPGWPPRNTSSRVGLPGYVERFGTDWVQQQVDGDTHLVRLRRLDEYRHMFEQPDRFLLLAGEEITGRGGAHVNAFNLAAAIAPRHADNAIDRVRNNLLAVAEQRDSVGRPMAAIVNHPNFLWALTAEEMAAIPELRIFELFNGHSMVNNAGDERRASTERIWDIALSLRHDEGLPPFFAAATDDAHHYREYGDTVARPGRGWVMVRAPSLAADDITAALGNGDFYATTGVTVQRERVDDRRIRIDIEPEDGVTYRIQFIGTRVDAPLTGSPVIAENGDTIRTTRSYDDRVGEVLAEVTGTSAEYTFRGDERYVRAKVISSRPHIDLTTGKTMGVQTAWLQPVFRQPARR